MSESPDARWTSPEHLPNALEQHSGPPTRGQRRTGIRIGIGLILLALLVIVLLDHYGILH
jgi:hypothetical protein